MEQATIVIDLGASENAHAFFPAHLQQYGFNRFELCKRNSLPSRFDLRGVSGEIDDLALAKLKFESCGWTVGSVASGRVCQIYFRLNMAIRNCLPAKLHQRP